ncbi:uncharacterized protein LOC126594745 [Malus sylvestris]|uniref:uncharacterized protein LOC126594745 n=1 Tax=Malus sylvestris TaxID=3752 RepID=UPI0021ACFCD5|nr:uncharacterized protein LOC126594745 [Malus sylvestris]XP_050116963.1 uncharacterized protein LOC126594745 [Malus sylvestris]
MDFANLQAQMANLTSQLSQYVERTTRQSIPTFDWSDHSNSMWWEPQPVQHEAYWQPYEEFYSRPMQPPQPHIQYAQSNSGSSIDYNQILNELSSLVQGSQNQANEAQQDAYWQPYEEFYTTPMHPPPHPPQQFQSKSSMSMDSDQILQLLTSLAQDQQNQDKKLGKLKNQMGEIMEFMAQIQEQSELSNSTIENLKEDFEIHDAIILESGMEVGRSPKTSKSSQEEDDQLLIEEDEEDTPTTRVEQPLPQPPRVPMPSNSGKVVPNSINSNPIPPNVLFARKFFIPKQEESEKDIVEALPNVQNDIPILGATKQVLDYVELFKGLCTPRRMIQEKVVAGEYQEFIKEDVFETTKPKDIEFYDTGQVPTITFNLVESNIPETF